MRFTKTCLGLVIGAVGVLTLSSDTAAQAHAHMGHVADSWGDTPEGAGLIENPVSKAPGFFVENVFVFAGVPTIMRAMFENVKYMISGGVTMRSRTIAAFLLEGEVAEGLDRLQERYDDLEIGSYPFLRDGKLGTSVVLRGTASERIDEAARELIEHIRYLGGEPVEDSGEAR